MARGNNSVSKFRKRPNFNIGMLIFGVIFLYVIISVIIYISSKKTVIYEINSGSIALNDNYTGLIVRNEQVVKSNYSGYVNYYLKDGNRASLDTVICSVDETGRVYNAILEDSGSSVSKDATQKMKDELTSLILSYDNNNYSDIYTVSKRVAGSIFDYQTEDVVNQLDDYIKATDNANFFHKISTSKTGLISYVIDDYINLTESGINDSLFKTDGYLSNDMRNQQIANVGDPIYKLITNDQWYIYIEIDDHAMKFLQDKTSVNMTFTDSGIRYKADFSIIKLGDSSYGKITLNKYLINYIDYRYVNIQITTENTDGLKIPVSAAFKSNTYSIPRKYLSNNGFFMVKKYKEDGSQYYDSIVPSIYYSDEDNYYVSMNDFDIGTIISQSDTGEEYVVSVIKELDGVYCVNRGYAVFKAIEIIDQNDEYYIVKKGTEYGLGTYDHIVLDHHSIKENQLTE